MVFGTDYPPNWAVLPNASLTIDLVNREWTNRPLIEVCGNREGFLSIGNILLWISDAPIENESLSITGLPFVRVLSALSLVIDQYCCNDKLKQSKIVRVDKDVQYEWRIYDELLQQNALGIISIAFIPDGCGDHYHVIVDDDSECECIFIRTDIG